MAFSITGLLRSSNSFIPRLLNSTLSTAVSSPSSIFNLARSITTTSVNFAEPLRKKKRIDPGIVRAREQRRQKKVEKQIRRLERLGKQYKPIDECEIPIQIVEEGRSRIRKLPQLTSEDAEERYLLAKEWSNYRRKLIEAEYFKIDMLLESQTRALDELRKESVELYNAALSIDDKLIPYEIVGPVETPPIENYDFPNGDYFDVSKDYFKKQY